MDADALKQFLTTVPALSVEKKVKLYLKLRAAKSAETKAYDASQAQFKLIMETIENFMLADADKAGVTGFKTDFGTTYTAESKKISIADDDAFRSFVLAQQDLDFFERRVSSTRVDAYIEEHKANPPGLNIFRERVMRVRKAGEK